MTTEEEDFWAAHYEEEDRRHKEANTILKLNRVILVLVIVLCIVYTGMRLTSP